MSLERRHLIAQLEAHYGRWLAADVITNHTSAVQMAADGDDRTFTMADFAKFTESGFKIAEERERLMQAARGLVDEEFEIMIKWRTLPKWAEAMAQLGYEWDLKIMKWTKDGDIVYPG